MSTGIEYVDETWNPVTGCTKISLGCTNCYAARMAKRLAGRFGYPEKPHEFDVTFHPDKLEEPLHWHKPRVVFVCSMGDLFHEDVETTFLQEIFSMMQTCNNHVFLVLTKRPKAMAEFMAWWLYAYRIGEKDGSSIEQVLPNVWLGVTIETQDEMWRVEELLEIPAAKHWVSAEPCLSTLDFTPWLDQLNWLVLGGETGPRARPMHPDWARQVKDDCVAAGVPFYFKNWGGWHPAVWLTEDGDIAAIRAEHDNSEDVFGDRTYMLPVPRRQKSGRTLDGQQWNEMPDG